MSYHNSVGTYYGPDTTVLLFTGLAGAGKSTLAGISSKFMKRLIRYSDIQPRDAIAVETVDGEALRAKSGNVSWDKAGVRAQASSLIGHVHNLIREYGSTQCRYLFVYADLVMPYRDIRLSIEDTFARVEKKISFSEVYVKTPIEEVRERRAELWEKAERGEVTGLAGFHFPYEEHEDLGLNLGAILSGSKKHFDIAEFRAKDIASSLLCDITERVDFDNSKRRFTDGRTGQYREV